jgi:LAO/AO transport system kinase
MKELAEGVLRGESGAAARALTCVVDERPGHEELWKRLYPKSGGARKIGFFGPPGSGKSSLIGAMIRVLRAKGEKVGVLAVDPTSPFTPSPAAPSSATASASKTTSSTRACSCAASPPAAPSAA